MAEGKSDALRFARAENIDFKGKKLGKCRRSKEAQGGVRRKWDVSLSKHEGYQRDCENRGRVESGLKLFGCSSSLPPREGENRGRVESGLKLLAYVS